MSLEAQRGSDGYRRHGEGGQALDAWARLKVRAVFVRAFSALASDFDLFAKLEERKGTGQARGSARAGGVRRKR
jgi:hypothetical protein